MLSLSYGYINYFFILCSLHCLILCTNGTGAQNIRPPASEFTKHRTVQPVLHHARTKRELTSTRDTGGVHHTEVMMKIPIDDRELVLDLQLSQDLVTDNHVLRYQEGGKTVTHKPDKENIDLCQYSGTVRGVPGSWVAVSTCHGVRGVIFDGEQLRHIEPAEGADVQYQHYVYDHSDLKSDHRRGYDRRATNYTGSDALKPKEHHVKEGIRSKRSTDSQVHGPYNANNKTRYVELLLVADHQEYIRSGKDLRTVYRQMKDITNIVNAVYAPMNVFIALVGVEVWTETDEIEVSTLIGFTLRRFKEYRAEKIDLPHDNAQLLTGKLFNNGTAGLAYFKAMCTDLSCGVGMNYTSVIGLTAMTTAHEMGHNLGVDHDHEYAECECPKNKTCIMGGYNWDFPELVLSTCSEKALVQALEVEGYDYCLRNKPKLLFDSPTCGNGFVEPGEQCDCGRAEPRGADPCHACCQPDTCMLRPNATCGAGACCDLQTCRPRAAGTECRAAERECDLPEYCTGHSEFCPDDVHKMDSTPCGKDNDTSYCAHGLCRSHDGQCRLLWGPPAKSSPRGCYTRYNVDGYSATNCGYNEQLRQHRRCSPQDALCGSLHCQDTTSGQVFGQWSFSWAVNYYYNNSWVDCKTNAFDPNNSFKDLSLAPDGAVCGQDMMCWQQRCVPVSELHATIAARESSDCPSTCSGHGVCNSKGHCHCERGFGPPLCALPGAGGSYDSGPASDITTMKYVTVAIYVIFLGIVPAMFLIFLIYYCRRDLTLWWKRPRRSCVDALLCGGCCTSTYLTKRTFVNRFYNTTRSIRQLFTFKSSAPKAKHIVRSSQVNTRRVSTINTDTKLNIVIEHPTSKSTGSKKISKNDIHLPNRINDKCIYANVQNSTNATLFNQNIMKKSIETSDKGTDIYRTVNKTSKISIQPKNISQDDTYNPHGSNDAKKLNTKSNIVNTPIKVTQTAGGLKVPQVKLKPAPKKSLPEQNKRVDDSESTSQGTVANMRRMFDTGNNVPSPKNTSSNVKVYMVKK